MFPVDDPILAASHRQMWEARSRARVPRSSAEVRRVFVHHIVEVEVVGQQEQNSVDQRDDEVNGEVEEIRSNAHKQDDTWEHARENGMSANLSQCSVRFI